jgi:hypothetical protein
MVSFLEEIQCSHLVSFLVEIQLIPRQLPNLNFLCRSHVYFFVYMVFSRSRSIFNCSKKFGYLDKINPNLKRFQKINHRRNYFRRITPFCFAIHGGDADDGASPLPMARQWLPRKISGSRPGSASPLVVATHKCLLRH